MTEEQFVHTQQLYQWVADHIQTLLSDLLSVEELEVQEALVDRLNEQFRFTR